MFALLSLLIRLCNLPVSAQFFRQRLNIGRASRVTLLMHSDAVFERSVATFTMFIYVMNFDVSPIHNPIAYRALLLLTIKEDTALQLSVKSH